jgi:hypothetical protein
MSRIILAYPGQKFAGLAIRRPDKTLDHIAFVLGDNLPKLGEVIDNKKVVELLTDEELLKEQSARALNRIEVVAVLGKQVLR